MMKLSYTRTALLASAVSSLLLAGAPLHAQEKQTNYTDVSAGAWYEQSASALLDIGALDPTEAKLRPNDLATRAEMMKLMVRVNDEQLSYPARQSFTDVTKTAWYYPYVETSARLGWVKGDNNCYGTLPCYARPARNLNRAEAAALLVRAFALTSTEEAPIFYDNGDSSKWYFRYIQTAADHCILQGDEGSNMVRPASAMNRAEMVTMFHRAYLNQKYSTDCSGPVTGGDLSSAQVITSRKIRLNFTADLATSYADDEYRYTVTAIGGPSIVVADATVTGDRTVELTLGGDLDARYSYRVLATDLRTTGNVTFTGTTTFSVPSATPAITSATALAANRVRVQFNMDLEGSVANDAFRYTVREVSSNSTIAVQSAVVVDARTVDLTLSSGVRSQILYSVTAQDITTTTGTQFDDDATFIFNESTADLTSVTATSPTTLRLGFSTDLDSLTAQSVSHYRVTGNNRDLALSTARLTDNRTIELVLGESLESQRQYAIALTNLKTSGGMQFSDTGTLVYVGGNISLSASLIGAREVPPVSTSMSGTGAFTLRSGGLDYDISLKSTSGSVITGAHFHRGATGLNGPVLQAITFTNNRAIGTWASLSEQDRNDLLNGNIYVNVHTQAHPDGEIRGQVQR